MIHIDERDKEVESARRRGRQAIRTFAEVSAAYLRAHLRDRENPRLAVNQQGARPGGAGANLALKQETASGVRVRIERVLAYAIAAECRKREDRNPARWDGKVEAP